MEKLKKRLILMIVGFFAMIFAFAYMYMQGMRVFEGEDIRYYVAVQKTVEAVTTAGFGGHAPWDSLGMNVIIIVMNLIGVSLFFFGVPIALAPLIVPRLKEAIKQEPSRSSDKEDHVIITEFTDTDEVLVEKLSEYGYDYLLIVDDKQEALELERNGHDVVYGSSRSTDVLRSANIEESKAIVVNLDDNINPSVLLSAKRYGEETDKISVVNSKDVKKYYKLSGSDFVLESRTELGKALGLRSALDISEEIMDITDNTPSIKQDIIHPDDDIRDKTIEDYSDKKNRSVLCGWFDGQFVPAPRPDRVISNNSILVTTGEDLVDGQDYSYKKTRDIIIAGYGSVGKSVEDTVSSRGYNCTTVDLEEESADINGDVTDPEVLKRAGISDADSVVVTINDDNITIYSILVANQINPDIDIICRVNKEENIWKAYESGANFVISLETLTGDVIANRIIDDKEFISPTQELNVESVSSEGYEGSMVKNTDLIEKHGFIIAIERDESLIAEVGGETQIKSGDSMIIIDR